MLSAVEFCYWLQGAFEIGQINKFTDEQASIVKHKLSEVQHDNAFTFSAKTLFAMFPHEQMFDTMYKDLQAIFMHDIDPSYEGDQNAFSEIHQGKKEAL